MKRMRILSAGLLFAGLIVSGSLESYSSEKYAGDFLLLGSGARALGMGGAYVAMVDDAVSPYYNAAGLTGLKTREANLMHSEQFGGLANYNSISFAAPISETEAAGFTLLHYGVGGIPVTRLVDPSRALGDSNRVEVSYRTDSADYALFLGGAKRFRDNLSLGAAVKILRRTIGKNEALGYGIDIGVQYHLTKALRFGASFRDVTGTAVVWDVQSAGNSHETRDRIAATADAGAAYTGAIPWLGGNYAIAGSMLFFGDSPKVKGIDSMRLGFEYLLRDILAFRGGIAEGNGAFGLGLIRLPLLASTSLDYAFLSHAELDSTHRFSMNVKF